MMNERCRRTEDKGSLGKALTAVASHFHKPFTSCIGHTFLHIPNNDALALSFNG